MNKTTPHPLRSARKRYNLTIEQLAKETSISPATIWRAEHHYAINAESRRRLCAYFHSSSAVLGLAELADEMGANQPESSQKARQTRTDEPGLWLLDQARGLTTMFEQQWTSDTLIESLHILIQGLGDMPTALRAYLLSDGDLESSYRKQIPSAQETYQLHTFFTHSIRKAWQFYHVARPIEVFSVAQAQQVLLKRVQPILPDSFYLSFHADVQNLIGASLYLLDRLEAAERVHLHAFRIAQEGQDYRNQVQSRNWQAIDANNLEKYVQAIDYIEDALHLVEKCDQQEFLCTRAHLLANWAANVAHLQEFHTVEEKLAASAELLEQLNTDDEFDRAIWHQIAGNCMLLNGRYNHAIQHFRQSLRMLPETWRTRRALSLIPLADAYARKREKEASLATAQEAVTLVGSMKSTMLTRQFQEYQQVLLHTFPRDTSVKSFIAHSLPFLHA